MDKEEIVDSLKRYKYLIISILAILTIFIARNVSLPKDESKVSSTKDSEIFSSNRVTEHSSNLTFSSNKESGYVDIKGAINTPGMYAFSGDTRVFDIVNDAGGFTEEADESRVNLSLKVIDQMVIVVPKNGEEIPDAIETTGDNLKRSKESESKININTATLEELRQLNGIGEKKAQVIIQHREENGSFHSIEEIKQVSGIGDKTFENIQNSITID